MRQDIRYLIVPDVHGRDFWVHPVEEVLKDSDAKIVFLGDYLDPYPQEWVDEETTLMEAAVICRTVALDRFKQILDLKRNSPERISLLLGNHDCGYAIGSDICDCRTDHRNYQEIEYLFKDNRNLFQVMDFCDIAGRHFIFSHAGLLKGWADQLPNNGDPIDILNNAWLTEDYQVLDLLADYDAYRGWGGYKYGSPVWSDIRSWTKVSPGETYGYNIVGHTQVRYPVVLDQIACIDCRHCFYLDSAGDLRDYDSNDILQHSEYKDEDW